MLIFLQKYFQFCTHRLKTQQPVLPYSKVKLEVPAEDDDIIILDDSDSPKKTRQKVRDCNNVNKHDETTKELCSYHREIVTRHDYKTLAEDEFLNDNIINFYLTWLYENLSDKYKEIVHIYSRYHSYIT